MKAFTGWTYKNLDAESIDSSRLARGSSIRELPSYDQMPARPDRRVPGETPVAGAS